MAAILKYLLVPLLATFSITDAAITGWTTPTITGADGTGTLTVAEDHALATTIETYVATTDANIGDYTLVTTGTPFALSTGGVLTITTALDFETTSSYTLEIKASDDAPATGIATITVTVTDVNEAPTFVMDSYSVNVADGAVADTSVMTVTASDQDSGDTITYSIGAGNSNNHFTIGSSTGLIKVKSGATLDKTTTAGYALEVEAADNDGTPLTGTTTVYVAVGLCSGATAIVASTGMFLLALSLTLLN